MTELNLSSNKWINSFLQNIIHSVNSFAEKQVDIINELIHIGESLSKETDVNKSLKMIVKSAVKISEAQFGVFLLKNADNDNLQFDHLFINKNLIIKKENILINSDKVLMPIHSKKTTLDRKTIGETALYSKEIINIENIHSSENFNITDISNFGKQIGYKIKSCLAMPILIENSEPYGVILIFNAVSDNGNICGFSEKDEAILRSLSSQSAISISNQKLFSETENFIYQLIYSTALTLDKKSKTQGNHLSHVAFLTSLITKEINRVNIGHFKDVKFSESQLKEISIASWLHDIGKLTTPDALLDKSKKLELVYDQIELIELRFNLFEKVIENKLAVIDNSLAEAKELIQIKSNLSDYLRLIIQANTKIFNQDLTITKLKEISEIKLSYNGKKYYLLTEEEYNKLCIRGYINKDEIDIIHNHVVYTKEILSKIKFPQKYQNVPFYAHTHHEKLNGKGYPDGLTKKNLPLKARIIPIADLIEALTAKRQFRSLPLSNVVKILSFMVIDNEIDKDICDLIIFSGILWNYTKKNMSDELLDLPDNEMVIELYKSRFKN